MYAQLMRKRRKASQNIPERVIDLCPPDIHRPDDPRLIEYVACRNERNNLLASQIGLPTVGQRLINQYELEFVVDGHVHLASVETVQRWRDGNIDQPEDLYPSIIPQNLSEKLTEFVFAVDRCTSKTLLVLDTTPLLRGDANIPHGHHVDSVSNEGTNLLFLDAAHVHETHIAHEIGHLWIQYVDQAEDMRVMQVVSDPARLHQLHFIQSFVLDLRVNEIIREKGFDMSVIEADEDAVLQSYGRLAKMGSQPLNRREGVFVALHLATHMLTRAESSVNLCRFDDELGLVKKADPESYALAEAMADAVQRHGFRGKDAIRASIDECLTLGFDYTGDGIDLNKDLVIPDQPEPEYDKYPDWLRGGSYTFKRDVGLLMAKEDIPGASGCELAGEIGEKCRVSFRLPDGSMRGPWDLDHPNPWWGHTRDMQMINDVNRRNVARQMKNQHQSPNFPQPPTPSQPPGFPDVNGGRRFYMAGYGRFLSAVRVAELMGGENPYAYALGNPINYIDPDGMSPIKPGRRPVGLPGGGFGECAVYVCYERTGPSIHFPGHESICVTGPHGGCSGGLYPDGRLGWLWPGKGAVEPNPYPCRPGTQTVRKPGGGTYQVNCDKVSSSCDDARRACECIKSLGKAPLYDVCSISANNCYSWATRVLECAIPRPVYHSGSIYDDLPEVPPGAQCPPGYKTKSGNTWRAG